LKEERNQHAETSQKHFHSQLGFDRQIIPRVDLPGSAPPRSKKTSDRKHPILEKAQPLGGNLSAALE
jgi:hypothetical protein